MKPHVDLATGKIYGCEEGSFMWLHEKGHIIFNHKFSFLLLIKGYIFLFWMLFVMASIVLKWAFPFAVFSWLFYVSIEIYEEWWCNKYAEKISKVKKQFSTKIEMFLNGNIV